MGFWSNVPFSSSSDWETEERGRLAGGSGCVGSHGVGEKREGRKRGRSPAAARAEVDHGDSAMVAGGDDRGGAIAELGGGSELGGKARGSPGDSIPPLTLGDGGLWTAPHGGGRSSAVMVVAAALESSRRAVRRRCELWWWWVALGPFYRR